MSVTTMFSEVLNIEAAYSSARSIAKERSLADMVSIASIGEVHTQVLCKRVIITDDRCDQSMVAKFR